MGEKAKESTAKKGLWIGLTEHMVPGIRILKE